MTEQKKASLPNAIDLADLDTAKASDKGAEIELLHPTKQTPLGIFVTVLGKDSEVFRSQVKSDINAAVRKEAFAKKRGKTIDPMTAEEAEEKAVELLVLCTLGWRSETYEYDSNGAIKLEDGKRKVLANEPSITLGGEKLSFSVINAKRVYTDFVWFRRQVDDAIGDLENFI
jgi:hypothetical protein